MLSAGRGTGLIHLSKKVKNCNQNMVKHSKHEEAAKKGAKTKSWRILKYGKKNTDVKLGNKGRMTSRLWSEMQVQPASLRLPSPVAYPPVHTLVSLRLLGQSEASKSRLRPAVRYTGYIGSKLPSTPPHS